MRVLGSCNRYPEITFALCPVAKDGDQLEVYIDLRLGCHTQPLLGGEIQWLITGGQLHLVLDNCTLVHSDLDREFAVNFEDDSTAYLFALPLGDLPRRGKLCRLGTFSHGDDPYTITGELFATIAHVSIVETQSLWRHDISPNKYGVLNRALARFLVDNELHPYLSKVTIGSRTLPPDTLPPIAATEALDNLEKLIKVIYEYHSDDFALLSGLAGLSIFDDYRGGNLSGCELSGLDFTGANLSRTNFRGANLTDACLSEADLSCAQLKGADLSGALLSNANLTCIDGYRCSLALANLIGADLEGANLTGANLTEANLSGAQVKGAAFCENAGMTEELRSSLLSRGAIFL